MRSMLNKSNKKNFKVSVITPVYNGEKYLEPFISSLKNQEFEDFEIIFIDDASIDNTYSILEKFQSEDNRVRLYRHSYRKGAAQARNWGMELSEGQYLSFFDADDLLDKCILGELYWTIKNQNVDISFCEWNRFLDKPDKVIACSYTCQEADYCNEFSLDKIEVRKAIKLTDGPSAFMFKKELIEKYHLQFQSLKSSNDVYFIEMAKMLAVNLAHVKSKRALYHLREHQTYSRISSNRNPMDVYLSLQAIRNKMIKLDIWSELSHYYFTKCIKCLYYAVLNTKMQKDKIVFMKFLQQKGLHGLGIDEKILSGGMFSEEEKYVWMLFYNGIYSDIEMLDELSIFVKANQKRIKILFKDWKNKKIIFWGIGKRWDILYNENKIDMNFEYCLVDRNRAGETYNGKQIVLYEQIEEKYDIIAVLNHNYLNEIKQEVIEQKGKEKYFDFEQFLREKNYGKKIF